ncbi:MAG: DUF2058 family protein [Candidatus Eisenbacteria bacterium]
MSDLREQLRKAGLVSDKELRRAKHEERIHAAEVGKQGVEAEQKASEEKFRAELEARKKADREREAERRRREQEQARERRVSLLILNGWVRTATAGNRRYFFAAPDGRIRFLDLSDVALRRVSFGAAAIVETQGAVRGEYAVVDDRTARELSEIAPDRLLFWNREAAGNAAARGGASARGDRFDDEDAEG